MGDQSVLKSSWNGGELSPLIDGRVDHFKYPQGMKISMNGIPTVHGALVRRPGTKIFSSLARLPVEDARVRSPVMVPHEISADRAYLYLFEPTLPDSFLVIKNRELIGPGFGYPLQSVPRRVDGTSILSTAQNGEDLYIADDGSSPLKKINNDVSSGSEIVTGRNAFPESPVVNWTGSDETPTPFSQNYNTPPFQDYKPEANPQIECTGSRVIGTVPGSPAFTAYVNSDLWAPVGTFTGKNGHRIVFNPDYIEMPTVQKWAAGLSVSDRSIFYHQNRYYRALIAVAESVALQTEPIHEFGAIYSPSDAGWKVQLGYIGNGHFSGTIDTPPDTDPSKPGLERVTIRWDMIDAPRFKTARWAWAAVGTGTSLETGAAYPDNVAIFRNRLVISAGNRLHFSRAGKLNDFNQYNASGLVTADSAITVEIPSRQKLAVEWLVAMDSLIIGGRTGVFECREDTKSEVFGPGNVAIRQISSYGSHSVEPVVLDSEIFYVVRGGKRLHRLSSDGASWSSIDMSVLADHLGASGICELAWQNEPWKVIWAITRDGRLVGMTWNREQDVWGWHPHQSDGGLFRGVACLPSPAGDIDDVWLATNRNFEGTGTASETAGIFVERFADAHQIGGDLREAVYTDCSNSFSGDAVTADPVNGGLMLTGATWDENSLLSLTSLSGPLPFTAADVGKVIRALDFTFEGGVAVPIEDGSFADLTIEDVPSGGALPVRPMFPVPSALQGRFLAWQLRVDRVRVIYMAGREASICVDGCAHQNVVADGAGWIQLNAHHNRIHVGFPCKFIAQTMRIEGGASKGTSQSKIKRISHVAVRLLESVGIKIGSNAANARPASFRANSAKMDEQVAAFSGDFSIAFPSGYTTDGYVYIESDQALPVTVVSAVIDVTTE